MHQMLQGNDSIERSKMVYNDNNSETVVTNVWVGNIILLPRAIVATSYPIFILWWLN